VRRIVVLVKHVPATERVKMDPETGTMVRKGLEMVINPLDLHAVEAAVRLKECSENDLRSTAMTMGPPAAADAVREAIAMGCDDGIHLCGRAFAGSDTWATAYVLSQAVRRLGTIDLVLCGERATDGETGQVGPMVGTMLDLPVLTYVSGIEETEDGALVVRRAIEGGHEVVASPLPALACVVKEMNEPRLPTLGGKIAAREAEIPTWGPEEIEADEGMLGLDGSPTRVVKVFYPTMARTGEIVSTEKASVEACVDRLLAFLARSGVVEGRS